MPTIVAPMPGRVVDIKVKVGDEVKDSHELCIIEAMKMQMPIMSPQSGVVREIKVEVGQGIKKGDILMEID